MNIILLVITFIFILLLAFDFTKGIILMTSTVFFLNYLGMGFPGVRMYLFLSLAIVPLYWINVKTGRIKPTEKYPKLLLLASVFFAFTTFVSTLVVNQADDGIFIFIDYCTWFVYPYILWHTINSKEKLSILLKCITILFVIAIVYNFIELFLNKNIFIDYIVDNNFVGSGTVGDKTLEEGEAELRFGLKRCSSIFAYVSTLGFFALSVFYLFYFLQFYYDFKPLVKKRWWYMLALLPVCVFLTGTRSVIICFVFSAIPLLFFKRFYKSSIFVAIILLLIVSGGVFFDYLSEVINTIVNTDEVGGSSFDLRSYQLKVSLDYWSQTPWWGHGRNYIHDYVHPAMSYVGGFEGIWFMLLVDYGTMGCLSFVLLVLACTIEATKYNKYFVFFPLAFLLAKTMASIIGVDYSHLIVFLVLLIKIDTYYLPKESK
ncbi:MAG: O-antigen ligase family protein [Prevotellaceae bacterium]|jgi:hypothetical protein|nr:O-antigen ligase family protein [Prevotellaceae bacterium]